MQSSSAVCDKFTQFSLEKTTVKYVTRVMPFLFINSFTFPRDKYCCYHSHFTDEELEACDRGHTGINSISGILIHRIGSNLSCYYCAICLSKKMPLYLLPTARFTIIVFIHSLYLLVGGLLYSNLLAYSLQDITDEAASLPKISAISHVGLPGGL